MKKLIRYIFLFVIIALSAFFIFRTTTSIQQKEIVKEKIRGLPSLSLYDLFGKKLNIQNMAGQHATVIIYFSPDCEHCQYEATEIKKNLSVFDNMEVLMVTRADATETNQFATDYELDGIANIHFLLDKTDAFYKTFRTHQFPSIFIYNKKQKLVKKFIGETKMEAIIEAIGS